MNNIAEIRQNVDDFEKFKNGIKKFFDRVDEGSQTRWDIDNHFSFLSKYGYKASCGFGKGKPSNKPYIVFIRIDSGYDSASKGVYCRVNILRGTDNVSIEINESEQKQIRYKAQQDCKQYNKDKPCKFKRNDLDDIVEQVLKDMEWFANLPLDSIKDNATITTKPQYDKNSQPDINKNKGDSMKTNPPLNQILYGPPGTGKTYSTIDKALEILGYAKSNDNGKVILDYTKIKQKLQNITNNNKGVGLDLENLDSKNYRELAKLLFDYYRSAEQGQIEFVTFHQSFSYEEFVEGIKPNTDNPANMIYKPKAGIFKEICKRALKDLQKIQERIKSNPYVWKISLEQTDSELYKYCLKNNEIRIGFQHEGGDKNASVRHFRDEMQKGDIVGIRHDEQSFNAIGVIVGDCDEKNIDKMATITETYPITRKIKWILIDNVKNIQDKKLDRNTVYQLDTTVKDLFAEIQDRVGYTFDDLPNQITCKEPYILIIDEINRGNISKILGELITLIEPSKRIGASEELRVTLPYSNDSFGVPSNLYIIGTMNTADRSIALLDTALRRRFEFVEMMPQWDNEYISTDCDGVNLQELLKTMNERIEFLLDREHKIGHSFFIKVNSLNDLQKVFKNNIIPLLQEYFYDDYAKIDAVLNHNGMVEIIETKVSELFPKKDADLDLEDKKIYKIKPFEKEDEKQFWNNPQTYKSIYLDKNE